MKSILKVLIVLILSLFFVSNVVIGDIILENIEIRAPKYFKSYNGNTLFKPESIDSGSVVFSQLPYEPDETWIFYTCSIEQGYTAYDNFWGVEEQICDIHWWGQILFWAGYYWTECDPTDMQFEIIFYEDSGGAPGAPVCTYSPVEPTVIPTGKFYADFENYYFTYDLDPCCNLSNGWISIKGISSPNQCWFLWAGSDDGDQYAIYNGLTPPEIDDDLAFQLTGSGQTPQPSICCEPIFMQWELIRPGEIVPGYFHVYNCGEPDSILEWSVDSWPSWMNNLIFVPPSGISAEGDIGVVVEFTFTAPSDPLTNFAGEIKVINSNDPNDFCVLPTVLTTQRNKGLFFEFFDQLFTQFPLLKIIFSF
jgi:hypothetical protein